MTVGRPLSPRELEVMRLMATGMTRKAVAAQLFLSEWTVRWHLERAYRKLGVVGLVEAMAALGWVRVPDDSGDFVDGVDFSIGEQPA